MRTWLTPQHIADLCLPGLPASKRGVLDLAAREGWADRPGLSRPATGRGGGVEFHRDLLPPEARSAYAASAIGAVVVPEPLVAQAATVAGAADLHVSAAEGRDARLALLAALDQFRVIEGLSIGVADAVFCTKYNLGTVATEPGDAWVRDAIPDLAPRTLQRWRAAVLAGTLNKLAVDPGARRRGKGTLETAGDGDVRTFCLALIAKQPHLSADHVRTIVADRFPTITLPAHRTFRHQLKAWRETHKVALAQITNPDLFKSRYRVAGRGTHPVARLNELWMIDASPADVLTTEGRHAVYVAIDIYSRRTQVLVTRTPRAEAVGYLMRKAMLAWGVPERLKTDNGSDFVAKWTRRLFASLAIEVEQARPFTPEEKGHVERVIGTFQRDLGPLLPGFIGHSVADRKTIEARKAFAQRLGEDDAKAFCVDLSPADLQRECDRWAADRYAHRAHDGLNGNKPFLVAAGYAGTIKTIEPRALDMLLAPIAGRDGIRTVSKSGIRIDGSWYLTPTVLPETRVLVRMDPADMGRALIFAADAEEFLGEAVCPALAGIDPGRAVAEARAQQKAILEEGMAEVRREMKAIRPRDMVDAVMRQAAKEAGVLVELPKRTEAHVTPAITAAAEASANPGEILAFPASAASTVSVPIEPPSEAVHVLHPQDTPQLRYRRAMALEARLSDGEPIGTDEALWLGGYAVGSEYRTMKAAFEDFGEAALR